MGFLNYPDANRLKRARKWTNLHIPFHLHTLLAWNNVTPESQEWEFWQIVHTDPRNVHLQKRTTFYPGDIHYYADFWVFTALPGSFLLDIHRRLTRSELTQDLQLGKYEICKNQGYHCTKSVY